MRAFRYGVQWNRVASHRVVRFQSSVAVPSTANEPKTSKRDFLSVVNQGPSLKIGELSNALYAASRDGIRLNEEESATYLSTLLKLRESEFGPQEISNVLLANRLILPSPAVKHFPESLSLLRAKIDSCKAAYHIDFVQRAFHGLEGLQAKHVDVFDITTLLSLRVMEAKAKTTGEVVATVLHGLQAYDAQSVEVRNLLNIIASKLRTLTVDMESDEIAKAFFGLQNMDATQDEVRLVLRLLTPYLINCREHMDAEHLGLLFFSLRNKSCDVIEVERLVRAMISVVRDCYQDLDTQEVVQIIQGMQRMKSENAQVKQMLSMLTTKIDATSKKLTREPIVNALTLWKNMDHACPEVAVFRNMINEKAVH